MIKLFIKGKDYTGDCAGLDELEEKVARKEDGTTDFSVSSEIVATGQLYYYLKELLYDNSCDAINEEYDVKILLSGCSLSFDMLLKIQGVRFDNQKCKAKVRLAAVNEDEAKIEILKHVFWNKDYGFIDWAVAHGRLPKMLHLHETNFLTYIVAYFWFRYIYPLLTVINKIIDVLDTIIFFLDIPKFNLVDTSLDLLGGGEFTTPPYVKDIMEYWCGKAGLRFSSSIFDDPLYEKTVLWSFRSGNGIDVGNHKSQHVDWRNLANLSPVNILDMMKPVHNADWKIIDGVLHYERVDFFETTRVKLFTLENEIANGNITEEFDYEFDNETNHARFYGEFTEDASDTQGNKAIDFYRLVKEWNPGQVHKNRKGEKNVQIKFGPLRCTDDFDKNSFLSLQYSLISPSLSHSIVIEGDTVITPKLIVLDDRVTNYEGTQFRTAYRVQLTQASNNSGPFDDLDLTGSWEYNTPYWMSVLYGDATTGNGFHWIGDPDLNLGTPKKANSIIWRPANFCEAVTLLRKNKLNTYIGSKDGPGFVAEYKIEYKKCQIKFEKVDFKCN